MISIQSEHVDYGNDNPLEKPQHRLIFKLHQKTFAVGNREGNTSFGQESDLSLSVDLKVHSVK